MNILFFASLKERLGCSEVLIELDAPCSVEQIKRDLIAKGEPWSSALSSPNLLTAVNQEISSVETVVSNSDELAFFPPVTGG
jgi:sulfur-carrier protein